MAWIQRFSDFVMLTADRFVNMVGWDPVDFVSGLSNFTGTFVSFSILLKSLFLTLKIN